MKFSSIVSKYYHQCSIIKKLFIIGAMVFFTMAFFLTNDVGSLFSSANAQENQKQTQPGKEQQNVTASESSQQKTNNPASGVSPKGNVVLPPPQLKEADAIYNKGEAQEYDLQDHAKASNPQIETENAALPAVATLQKILVSIQQKRAAEERKIQAQNEQLELVKNEIDDKIKELNKVQADLVKTLEKLDLKLSEKRAEKVVELTKIVQGAKPASAAKIMQQMDTELAVEILQRMSKRTAGAILGKMPPEFAAQLSEIFTHYDNKRKVNKDKLTP